MCQMDLCEVLKTALFKDMAKSCNSNNCWKNNLVYEKIILYIKWYDDYHLFCKNSSEIMQLQLNVNTYEKLIYQKSTK